ncbi:hypothetical protein HBI56_199040 [Parastagonospora nodorum]|nr:hypothetical protein HBH53_201420 [Parastagonospora nodorum]KAH3959591.1 hypothetical protein HBH51_199120 [Parastagonospora nodorum]KAH3964010.1 hypothetical protein HBH52_214520 [Parastagonospora nodorum]KAH3992885.1 hypothetical protein HBI10_209930 [Parastagonospora nodorum]KAH4010703.1 hypothetical protein HBI13_206270 [Parastagonospora nodorum]
MPSFLSSTLYFFQLSTGTIITLQGFQDFVDDHKNNLVKQQSRPSLNTDSLDGFLKKAEPLKPHRAKINAFREKYNIKQKLAARYTKMAEAFQASTQRSRDKTAAKQKPKPFAERGRPQEAQREAPSYKG